MKYYSHSGFTPPGGLLLSLAAGLITAVVMGTIYTFFTVYVPFIYLNFLATLAFGAAIGYAVGWAAKAGKIRNPGVVTLLALVFALVGIYVEWGVSPLALIGGEVGLRGFSPDAMFNFVAFLYENGSWGMGAGGNVTGPFLAAIWLTEAGAVIGLSVMIARGATKTLPFCERCHAWTTVEPGVQFLMASGGEPEWDMLSSGGLEVLNQFDRAQGDVSQLVRLDVSRCETCSESNFLTAQTVKYTADKNGNVKEDAKPIVTNLIITPAEIDFVRQCGREVAGVEEETGAETPPAG